MMRVDIGKEGEKTILTLSHGHASGKRRSGKEAAEPLVLKSLPLTTAWTWIFKRLSYGIT
jgi:hypothetical protein